MRLKNLVFCLSVVLVTGGNAYTQGKFSGLMFGDYYYMAANHNRDLEKKNGFWFRRIYFTYDHGLSDAFSLRFRIEMNSEGKFKSKGEKMAAFVKNAFLKWNNGRHSILLGISSTPTLAIFDKVWGYRSVEKTPLDLQKFGNSSDFGLAIKGSLDSEKQINYHIMVANGDGNSSETNAGKKVMFSLSGKNKTGLIIEGYFDFEERPGKNNRYTLYGFAGYQGKTTRFGIQFALQNREVEIGDSKNLQIGSAFVAAKLSEKIWGFARVDRTFDANPEGAEISYIPFDISARSTLLLGGLDFRPIENVHLMPNIEVVLYSENDVGISPHTDIIPRFTFNYVWK